jgi:hypothetical protein
MKEEEVVEYGRRAHAKALARANKREKTRLTPPSCETAAINFRKLDGNFYEISSAPKA